MICEFNPFHNGHKFLLEKIKSEYADDVICVMSGDLVQRGETAITDKYSRAEAALNNGADIIAELPTVYAVSSARIFGARGVQLAYELGCDKLCFGAENSLEELYSALGKIDSAEVQAKIAASMKDGNYYPRAVAQAVGEDYAAIVEKPNNILALEYIRACRVYGIEPAAIHRIGPEHDSGEISEGHASASKLRELILAGKDYTPYTPMTVGRPASPSELNNIFLYRLKTASLEELKGLAEIDEGLENRLLEAAKNHYSLTEILRAVKTKRYTMARLMRIMLYILLGVTKEMQASPVPYIRVLGVRADKKRLISSRSLPLIADVRRGYDRLDEWAKQIFDIDLKAAELMNIASGTTLNEFSHGLIAV